MSEHTGHQPDDNYDEKIEKMVSLTVSAVRGTIPQTQISIPLAQIAAGDLAPPAARELARTLSRILKGERDPIALVESLPQDMAEIVWEALDAIDAPSTEDDDDEEREEISFEDLIEKVAEACTGEVVLWQRLWDFTEELTSDTRVPQEVQTLGHALRKILAGERQRYLLDDLAPQYRWAVAQLLAWLNAQAVTPPSSSL